MRTYGGGWDSPPVLPAGWVDAPAVRALRPEAKSALASFAPQKWDSHWKFVAGGQAWIDEPKYQVWRTWVIAHMIHHRAQLGVYLRLLNKPIPGTYGPSADEH